MPLSKKITVAILTYKKEKELNVCLASFLNQKNKFKRLLIDNDFEKSAFKIFLKFKKKLDLHYFSEPSKNISKARNLAIKNCQSQYLAFIDDDCTLSKNWSEFADLAIKKGNNLAFIQGGSVSKNLKKAQIAAQNNIYQNWIKYNLKDNFINPQALDTKNIILNLKLIKKYKIIFDANLPIFEDVDFGLQIKKHQLYGEYIPEMLVEHLEISDFKKLIKKFYFRGKIKYILNKKWGNFDNFSPNLFNEFKTILKQPFCFYKNILNQSFNLGFLMAKYQKYETNTNTIFIINCMDKAANQERLLAVYFFLKLNGFEIKKVDSQILFKEKINSYSGFKIDPLLFTIYRLNRFLIYKFKFSFLKSYLYYWELLYRGKLIKHYLTKNQAKIVISQYPMDLTCSLGKNKFKIIFDIPTIYSEEIKNGYDLSKKIIKKINVIENEIYNKDNYFCFHWYSFMEFAQKINKKPKKNFVLNWGCYPKKNKNEFDKNPKMIYMGNLNSPWINPKLLEFVQKKSSILIDVFSYEKPSKENYSLLKFKGFMKKIDKISDYQFGLLTFTNDELRNNGFSAKHLLYLSYGLPVLCPEWRKDKLLKPATIYYNAENFNQQIKKYSQKKYWNQKHLAAIKLAKKLDWNQTLKAILPIIYKIQNEI